MTLPRSTQVAIIGAGPAGLVLAQLLSRAGVDCVVLESRSRFHVESRLRAAVLEPAVAELLRAAGLGARMDPLARRLEGIRLHAGEDRGWKIDLVAQTGRCMTLWGQHEIVRDAIALRQQHGLPIIFSVSSVTLNDVTSPHPRIRFRHGGWDHELACDFVAGCDGFNGACRAVLPPSATRQVGPERPLAWFGVLGEAEPSWPEQVYAASGEGFAFATMRPPALSRYYFQCDPNEDVHDWSADRIWDTLHRRLDSQGIEVAEGRIIQRSLIPLRSVVTEPMQHGRLFLLGDAAHLLPLTGAKGLNTAVRDTAAFASALLRWYRDGDPIALANYSEQRSEGVRQALRFSTWFTELLHLLPSDDAAAARQKQAALAALATNPDATRRLANAYVGKDINEPGLT